MPVKNCRLFATKPAVEQGYTAFGEEYEKNYTNTPLVV